MTPQLETLEGRDCPDALLAYAYETQVLPAVEQHWEKVQQVLVAQVAQIFTVAAAEAATLGPRGNAAALANLHAAGAELLSFYPTVMASYGQLAITTEAVLRALPPQPNELGDIQYLLSALAAEQPTLTALEAQWLAPI